MGKRRYLSIDCGGTKTAFLLCGENGEAEAACTLGPANYMVNGIGPVLSILEKGIGEVCGCTDIRTGGVPCLGAASFAGSAQ